MPGLRCQVFGASFDEATASGLTPPGPLCTCVMSVARRAAAAGRQHFQNILLTFRLTNMLQYYVQ